MSMCRVAGEVENARGEVREEVRDDTASGGDDGGVPVLVLEKCAGAPSGWGRARLGHPLHDRTSPRDPRDLR